MFWLRNNYLCNTALLVSFINATPIQKINSPDSFEQVKLLVHNPAYRCYQDQGGDLIFVLDFFEEMTKIYDRGKLKEIQNFSVFFAEKFCSNEASCIEETLSKIRYVSTKNAICDYASNKNACEICVKEEEQRQKEENEQQKFIRATKESAIKGISWFGLVAILFSFFYLLFSGIFYLIKKRLPSPRWLFFLALISFLAIVVILIIWYVMRSFVQVMY